MFDFIQNNNQGIFIANPSDLEIANQLKNIRPTDNNLLMALPADVLKRLQLDLKPVAMPLGKVIYESGIQLEHVYFPIPGCIISMLYVLEDGSSAEIAVVGNDGMVGIALFMGGDTTPSRAVVQSAGFAFQLEGNVLKREFQRHAGFQHLLLRFTQALITQMTQTAVCNRHHSIEQQLCRWLLLSLDRLSSNELSMTQELIANLLGVRREGVTEAAGKSQDAGLIRYSRGHIYVLNRDGLEKRVCECYAVVKIEYGRLLPEKRESPPPFSRCDCSHLDPEYDYKFGSVIQALPHGMMA